MIASRTKANRTRIEDVAAAAGVSIMTVSRALRGIEGVSVEKRAHICRLAQQMDYMPNRSAQSLAVANSNLMCISVPTLLDNVFAEILEGMRATFDRHGYDVVLDVTAYKPEREQAWVERIVSWRPAGIILATSRHNEQVRRRLKDLSIPTVEIWDFTETPIHLNVGVDHRAAGSDAAEWMLELGYRRPAFVGVTVGRDICAELRLSGFADVFRAGKIEVIVARDDMHASFEAGMNATSELIRARTRPDVLFFLNDHMALGGISACHAAGLSVPGDIGVLGFNNLGVNKVLRRPISSLATPRYEMGAAAARLLVATILGSKHEKQIKLPVRRISGLTTRAVS
jgi:LacI family transcriptional regulator, gluconate utilization system Gnt-I transcriptional repressor